MTASLIIPRGVGEAESKYIVVRKVDAVSKSIPVFPTKYQARIIFAYDESASEGTCTYVLDTGIEIEHPVEFEGRARFVQNFVDNADLDANGQGTHIAGTIGSKTHGVAKKTQLFAIKVLNEYTVGQTSGILAGMEFFVEDAIQNDTRALFSNYGVSVDVFAPGVDIKSTWAKGGVKLESGALMATPHVTGLAAYLLGLKDIKA
ncbi:hypothetical protein FGADI_9194 [Fusarium gaditjirri]|uniref:Peptidase S8/S53 domain-containing protein n=1 Tax=Fusarium gaditjirri TaxID=282569 RepID=A0A8H4T062_9HYPO|nr:hypothetical protein FGADI_9194 [Fusarium gaditjirri]